MFKEHPIALVLFCGIVSLCMAVLQYLMPQFSFFDGGLVVVILLTVLIRKNIYTVFFGMLSMLLTLISSFYEVEGVSQQQLIWQRLFSMGMMLLSTFAVLYVKNLFTAIEEDQSRMNALFEHATEGIILTNSRGEILLANPASEAIFKYTRYELIGQPVEKLIPDRFRQHHESYRNQFYRSPSNRRMGHARDLYARDKEGHEFPVEISLSHFRQQNESFVIAFIIDITQRKKAETDMTMQRRELEKVSSEIRQLNTNLEAKVQERTLILKEALQELEQSQKDLSEALDKEKELNEIKSRFVSMASHEFRTPLSSVLSSASLLSRYTKTEEQDNRDRHIHRIKDSVKHLNDLLEDFLSLGKLEEGKVTTRSESFLLNDFLEDIVDEMKAILKAGQEIRIDCQQSTPMFTDKKLLKNILINLISNAIKFSGEQGRIRIAANRHDNIIRLSVADNGMGIPEEDQQHLFSSFFRGKNAVNIQGTGLGLHIVKRYADLINGQLSLESVLGKGTTVTLSLPEKAIPG